MKKDFVSIHDRTPAEIGELLDLADAVKTDRARYRTTLSGKTLAMIFEKSSTRTRVSFEAGMYQLGGLGMFLSSRDLQIGRGEPIADTARVLSCYVDGIMARTFAHETVTELARHATVPVINGLTDLLHPCQVMADLQTIRETFGRLAGLKLAYVGDGNNMAHSLMFGGARTGMSVAVASPAGYEPKPEIVAAARQDAEETGAAITTTRDPAEAVAGAHVVYTDVWASMGQEEEAQVRRQKFAGFSVTDALMEKASRDAIFLHCLPAHRGEEVAASVADGPRSRIFEEAENRLHAQKAILVSLMA
ncbi:MAG TPA: ornithine carbamoyltransferase [Thermoanaerobaculia bacterium]|nr:ornithine carbamoyltransferase [Thermoanaerobaculia bacterium]